MLRKGFVLLAAAALSLTGCENGELGPDADEQAEVNGVDETDPDEVPTPVENLDDCAEVSAAEGAPAGLTMMDSFFEPPCIAVSSTQQISLTNAGNLEHNFSVADGDISVDVEPGEEAITDELGTDLAAGSYRFFCEYHEEEGMVGTLVVE